MHPIQRFKYRNLATFLVMALIVAGCATQPPTGSYDPPGFLMGLVHGFTMLFSLIGSIFFDIRVYAYPNSGGFYDLGYFIGASAFLGGGGASAK